MFQAFLPPLGGDRLRLAARILTVLQPVFLVLGRAVADWSLGICVVLFLINSFRNRDGAWLRERWVQASLLLWGWLFIVALGAHDPGAAFVHAAGWIRFPLFAAAIVFWVMDRDWLRFLLIVTGATLVFVACDTLLQYVVGQDLFGNPISDANRLTGPFSKKMVGIYLARLAFLPLIPAFAAAVAARRKGLIAVVGGAGLVVFLAVLLSGERMATVSLLLGLALLPILKPSLWRPVLGLGLVLVVLLGGILAAEPDLFRRHVGQTSNTLANFEQSPYGLIWRNALKVTAEHPVFGLGMRNFRYACTCTEYTACGPQDVFCALHPHNTYLEWVAETGVPGLAGFLLLIGLWFVRLVRARRENLLSSSAIGGWIAVGLGLWPFASTGSFFSNWNAVIFWLVLGTALAATEWTRCAKQPEGR